MLNKSFYAAIALFFLSSSYATTSTNSISGQERNFIGKVSQGGMFEVQAGKLGSKQGASQVIKDQGATEAHDHQLVGDKLNSIASKAGINLPSKLNSEFQQKLADLNALSGAAFDNAYLKEMKAIHAKDGAAFAKEAKSGTNQELKAFAAETYSIVQMHIGELRALRLEN